MVLRKVFGPNKEELREGWRKFHNFRAPCFGILTKYSVDKARCTRWTGHVVHTQKEKFGRRILVEKPAEFISCLPTALPDVSFSNKVHVIMQDRRIKYCYTWSPHHCAVWFITTSIPRSRRHFKQFTFASLVIVQLDAQILFNVFIYL